jgi:hypothetical protein
MKWAPAAHVTQAPLSAYCPDAIACQNAHL